MEITRARLGCLLVTAGVIGGAVGCAAFCAAVIAAVMLRGL